MGAAAATTTEEEVATQFRAALDLALAAADADERIAPALCANGLRLRFEFTDSRLALSVAAGEPEGHLRWTFDAVDWEPLLTLSMSSRVANRFLLGRESLAVAIARGEVEVSGGSRAALAYLPAMRLISGPYRRVVEAEFPGLAG